MKEFAILTLIVLTGALHLQGQTTITLQPDAIDGKDAYLRSLSPNTNYGTHNDYSCSAWTNSGDFVLSRGLVEFDLSIIPQGSTILSAELSLYSYTSLSNGSHSVNIDNSARIERVTSAWNESTVTWANQPATTTQNSVGLAASTMTIQDYLDIDVSAMVQDMVDDPANSHGFFMHLNNEQTYRRLVFGSSDNPDPNLRPKLVITYSDCLFLRPALEGKDVYLRSLSPNTNHGTHPDFSATAWTNGGNFVAVRGIIDFDLSSIPIGAVINSADLSLYSYNSSANGTHSGSNSSSLERITSPWMENTVTWNTQPTTTTQNAVILAQSTAPIQHYLDIDITPMVQDWVNDPSNSHGIMMKLLDEQIYHRMLFASSDNPDSTLHPSLQICYSTTTGVSEQLGAGADFELFPNPAESNVTIALNETQVGAGLMVLNNLGQTVLVRSDLPQTTMLSVEGLTAGVYTVLLLEKGNGLHVAKKLVVR